MNENQQNKDEAKIVYFLIYSNTIGNFAFICFLYDDDDDSLFHLIFQQKREREREREMKKQHSSIIINKE